MEYIDLKDYLRRLMNNWLIIVLCCVVGGVAAFIYSNFMVAPVYSSSVKIGVYNSDWSNKKSSMSDIQASLGLIETCTVVLEDDVTAETISQALKEEADVNVSPGKIKSALSFSQIGDSQWLQVSARTTDPELSAMICNAAVAKTPELLVKSVADIEIKCLGQAKVNDVPVAPNVMRNVIIGVLASLVLVCGVIFLLEFFDNTIRDDNKLVEKYDLCILGTIPNIYNSPKNNKGSNYSDIK
ncbi:MAG: hypothetical protein IKL40_06755 [Clostridia bacterium]|nr:hypothetical protein [Clostridia bacterium]